ncbi:irregular chiasm C-roughest protein [Caerostris extrusa]|uniref:Irregular chiasm C-roughest protein n=1 Tax=Caerostris extrusa TaxID=172846 RepID=A0AAV4MIB5_CAEEX|nr:irregular chiasm C-roughest protein [Caerostris extrusa]
MRLDLVPGEKTKIDLELLEPEGLQSSLKWLPLHCIFLFDAPVCKENQQITYVVGLNESVVVRCEVEAQPTDVTFKWEFSNTIHKHYNLQHTSEGVVSNATYMPITPSDYGTLFCWANNSIGHQQSSCFFTVIAPACKTEKSKANASSSSKGMYISYAKFSYLPQSC